MHGKKREEFKAKMRDPKTAKVLAQKAEQWYILMMELGDRWAQKKKNNVVAADADSGAAAAAATTQTTLALLGKALLVNPDSMNLWNHRRELILTEIETSNPSRNNNINNSKFGNNNTSSKTIDSIVHRERALTGTALQKNPKAYGAWFHRKWILQTFRPSETILSEDLGLTETFLKADERNFHCWNFRRFLVACLGGFWDGEWKVPNRSNGSTRGATVSLMGQQVVDPSKESSPSTTTSSTTSSTATTTTSRTIPSDLIVAEFDFTTEKIAQNFSNFSAFHYRSQLLDLVCDLNDGENENDERMTRMEEIFDTEFRLVEDAVCTEPDDQTCWWYHAILLDKLAEEDQHRDDSGDEGPIRMISRFEDRLLEQADLFREILEDSPDSKWVILGLFKVLKVLGENSNGDGEIDNGDETETESETGALLEKLQSIDPYRSKRYEYLRIQQSSRSNDAAKAQ